MPSIVFIVFAAHEVARKFSKGLNSNTQKFGTVKGPITRIGQKVLSDPNSKKSGNSNVETYSNYSSGMSH